MNTADIVYNASLAKFLDQHRFRCRRYHVDITFSPKAEYMAAGSPHRHRAHKTLIGETCSCNLQTDSLNTDSSLPLLNILTTPDTKLTLQAVCTTVAGESMPLSRKPDPQARHREGSERVGVHTS